MRRPVVAGNWKMHGSRSRIQALVAGIAESTDARADVIVFPPAIYLAEVIGWLAGSRIAVGAQNVHAEVNGAFTGEISAQMVADVGGEYVLVGHSERRALFAETDAMVAAKFGAVQAAGLVPILCVGETLAEREAGRADTVVIAQVDAVLAAVGIQAFARAMIAYEPVWAIGTGRTAAPADAQAMHVVIRRRLAAADTGIGAEVRVLYGGSVNAGNAQTLFAQPDIDGGLVGGASLDGDEFTRICKAA